MEKACCEFKVFETDKGFRVLATGDFKTNMLGCCVGKSDEGCCQDATIIKHDCCQVSIKRTEDGLEMLYEGDKAALINRFTGLFSKGCCD